MRLLDDKKAVVESIRWSKNRVVTLGLLIVLVHSLLVLALIPALGRHLVPSLNQDKAGDGYDYIALNLASGNGYRFYPDTASTLMREPGYPLILAGLIVAFGQSFFAVKVVNVLFALGTAYLIARVVRSLSTSQWPMLAAPLLYLFHPGTLIAESRCGVEVIFSFLIVLFVLTLMRAIESAKARAYMISGLVLGITVLVRSVPLLFPIWLLAYLLLFERRRASIFLACRNVAILMATVLIVLSPWIIRNYRLTGKFVPTASVLGVSAQAGQYINMHRSEGKPWWLLDREAAYERDRIAAQLGYPAKDDYYYQTFYRTADEIKFSNFLFARVVNEDKKAPLVFVKFAARNLFNFWFTGKSRSATAQNVLVQLPYIVLAGIGIVIGIKNGLARTLGPILLFCVYMVTVYLPILAQARYSVPLVPFLSILGTLTLIALKDKVDRYGGPVSTTSFIKTRGTSSQIPIERWGKR